MKIVFLAPFGIRPKGTLLARMLPLAAALQKLGHTITIIAPPYTNPEDSGLTETVNGVRLVNVQLGPGGRALSSIPVACRMLAAALNEKPDIIQLFKPKGYGGIAAMMLLGMARLGLSQIPLFLDTDDLEGSSGMNQLHAYSGLEKFVYNYQEQWLTGRARGITVASLALERFVSGMGVAADKILYLPNCVEDQPVHDGAAARRSFGIAPETPLLLLYTRFFEFNQDRLHELFAAINRRLPATRFLVVGRGRNNEELLLQEAGRKLGFTDALIMAGWVEPKQLPGLLAAADMAIYPFEDTSVNQAKCPAKLTELLRGGIPVIADRVGQIPEYLSPQLHDFLCSPGDVDSMAASCIALLENRAQSRELGLKAKEYILKHFSWMDYAARLEQFYKNNLKDR